MHGNTTISLQRTGSERKNSVGWDPTEFHRFSFWKESAGRLGIAHDGQRDAVFAAATGVEELSFCKDPAPCRLGERLEVHERSVAD